MKTLKFVGGSLKELRAFPQQIKQTAGHQLMVIQLGGEPDDWKPMLNIGSGVRELKIKDNSGQYRVIYVAKFDDAVYVLHAFKKKTQKTAKRDIDLARQRYNHIKEAAS